MGNQSASIDTINDKCQKKLIKILGNIDYIPTKSELKQRIITYIFNSIITEGNLYLDFSESKSELIKNNNAENSKKIGIAPPNFWTMIKICLNPEYQILESHMKGKWYCTRGNILDFILLLDSQKPSWISWFYHQKRKFFSGLGLFSLKQFFNKKEATEKTKKHYNWSAKWYKQMLGKYMIYSCAFFDKNHTTLDAAQKNKINITMDRLEINKSNMNILDIGCGWGELMQQITNQKSVKTHGISIAQEQIDYAKKQIKDEFKERISFEKISWRSLKEDKNNLYDRIVSVGMLEHVGKIEYKNFFKIVSDQLKPGGKALIHSICKHERGFSNKWIDKYIFHGGYIPRVSEVIKGAEKQNQLALENVYFHSGENYIKTLQFWLINMIDNHQECLNIIEKKIKMEKKYLKNQSIIEQFAREQFRMWFTYLTAIQIIFMISNRKPQNVNQFVFRKIK